MDQDIERIYDLIVHVNYPITLDEIRNPTSECMVKMVLTFLSGLSIDGKSIQKATFGQETCLSYPEAYEEITSFVNLHEVMQKVCKSVFIKDFYLTDITSPGAKKARRLIFTLINFAVYSSNKMEEMIEPLTAIDTKLSTLNDLIEKKNQVMELRKEIVLENSKKTALKEKYLKQIEEAKSRIDQKNKGVAVVDARAQNAKQTWQKAQQIKGSIKQQVLEINEKIAEMESTVVVESPEQYQTKLGNYGQDCTDKKEKLQAMIERLRAKRELKSQFEKVQDFVSQEYAKFPKVQEAHLKSKKLAEFDAKLSKQYNEMQAAVQKLHEELANANDNNQCDAAKVDEIQAQCQEHIAPLLKSHKKYIRKSQELKNRLEEAQIRVQQSRIEKQELTKTIASLEEEIGTFLKDCQDLYMKEIQKEVEVERLWKSKYNE